MLECGGKKLTTGGTQRVEQQMQDEGNCQHFGPVEFLQQDVLIKIYSSWTIAGGWGVTLSPSTTSPGGESWDRVKNLGVGYGGHMHVLQLEPDENELKQVYGIGLRNSQIVPVYIIKTENATNNQAVEKGIRLKTHYQNWEGEDSHLF